MLKKLAPGILLAGLAFAQAQNIEGIWQGSIEINGINLRLAFHISKNEQGAFVTKWDSLDQGARDMPARATTFADGKLRIEVNAVTKLEGTLNAAGTEIDGTFTQSETYPIHLKRVDN